MSGTGSVSGWDGYLIRFLADSQAACFWYLYLTADGSDAAIVWSPDFYGTETVGWQTGPVDPSQLLYTAPSFEIFLGRFWLENAIWFAESFGRPMPEGGAEYVAIYRHKEKLPA